MRSALRPACPDCDTPVGDLHRFGCDVENCPYCGRQLLVCGCDAATDGVPDSDRMPWTGEWPGTAECREFGWYQPVEPGFQEPFEDINRLYKDAVWGRDAKRFLRKDEYTTRQRPEDEGPGASTDLGVNSNRALVNDVEAARATLATYLHTLEIELRPEDGGARGTLKIGGCPDSPEWPNAWPVAAPEGHPKDGEPRDNDDGRRGFTDLLRELAPHLAESLTVQATRYSPRPAFRESAQWKVTPGAAEVEETTVVAFPCGVEAEGEDDEDSDAGGLPANG